MIDRAQRFVWLLAVVLLFGAVPAEGQYGFHFGQNKVQYENFDWQILKTDHFEIYYYPEMEELAEYAGHFAEEAYSELQHRFDFSLSRPVPLIIYSTARHFRQTNVRPGFIPPGVGGFFEFLKGRVVIPSNGDIHRFRRVIRHELVHVFTFTKMSRVVKDHRKSPGRYLPLWFTEGLAEHWSGSPDHQYETIMRDAVVSNVLVPLDDIHRISGTYLMYKQGESICRFISQTYGDEMLLRLIENSWKHKDFRQVMELTLHEDFTTISDRWEEWVRDEYYPTLGDAQLASLNAQAVETDGYNAKPVAYTHPDGSRSIYMIGNKTGYTNVYEIPVDSAYQPTGEARILIEGGRTKEFEAFHPLESRLDITEDGQLTFVTKSGGNDVVHVYDLERDKVVNSYRFPSLVTIYSPSWSPDGRYLAFSSIDKSGFSDLYVYDTVHDELERITQDPYDDRDPAWHPEKNMLAFSSDRTTFGADYAYNIFTIDVDRRTIEYVTHGDQFDFSPRWSPEGGHLVFTSSRKDSAGQYGAQNVWAAEMQDDRQIVPFAAGESETVDGFTRTKPRRVHRLTNFTTAAHDPVWTSDDDLLFTSFEHFDYSVQHMSNVDSLLANPRASETLAPVYSNEHWSYTKISERDSVQREEYTREYDLDIAQSQINQNPVWGTTGGAFVTFSDMLGDDLWYATVYNTASTTSQFWESLNAMVARMQLHRRANISYGAYRFAGRQYDITDPNAAEDYPVLWETMYGGFGRISYPLSRFRRVEVSTSLNWSDKEIWTTGYQRKALLLSNSLSLVHDNALYGPNGPIDGWRGNVTGAYTTDILYNNVNYYSLSLDLRNYWRISRRVTFASWGLGRINSGREARLWVLGGSWDLRGFPLFDVRGQKMWFTSHELRFPIFSRPSMAFPVLAPFGIQNLRGAVFADAAHAWNDNYHEVNKQLHTGQDLGAIGGGLRMNLFGGFVLRYDIGYRFRGDFSWDAREPFRQFFFGWNF